MFKVRRRLAFALALALAPSAAWAQFKTVTVVNGEFTGISPIFGAESGLGTTHIEWGVPVPGSFRPFLDFEGYDRFPDREQLWFESGQTVLPNAKFLAGYLTFRNGTVEETSSSLDLSVDLKFYALGSNSGLDPLVQIDTIKLQIRQTPNDGTQVGSADYVHFPNRPELKSFRVFEASTARVPLYLKFGSLIPAGFGDVEDPSTGFISPSVTDNPFEIPRLLVAKQDFDGGAVRMTNGFNPATQNINGGAGSFFGVGSIGAWPQGTSPGMPFSLADDSVANISRNGTAAPFPNDGEGLFGQNRAKSDNFFAIADTRSIDAQNPFASWTFDISNFKDLALKIDLGAIAGGSNPGFPLDSSVVFEYSIDGGAPFPALGIQATSASEAQFAGFVYRAMDNGVVPTMASNGPLKAIALPTVTKTLAETGAVATETFLNKTPSSGPAAGQMDTFTLPLFGVGSQLTLTVRGRLAFEGMAFDNIVITGIAVPEPASLLIVLALTLGLRARPTLFAKRS
jgi:hypothetical protein